MDDKQKLIRDRAYLIWKEQGEAHGRDAEHWLQAERDIDSGYGDERAPPPGNDNDLPQSPLPAMEPPTKDANVETESRPRKPGQKARALSDPHKK